MNRYIDELTFWVQLALGVALFSAGFLPLFKIVVAHVPVSGLKEAMSTPSA